ncbi:MAG: type II secretion system minor pseudopilin GspI [Pseudomonadota bacterium]
MSLNTEKLDLQQGFTLLEVLVAMTVLAIALASIIKVSANQAINTEHLRDKTLAHWVAMNQIAQLQLTQQWPSAGKKSGDEEMGWHEWHWQSIVSNTPDSRVRRIQINVFRNRDDESPVTQLSSFLSQPK